MDYQPQQQQQQASGSGSGSDEGKSVPRPLRAPAPGPLNLNFSQLQPQFQFQQQQQQNQQQQQGQGQGQNSGQNQNSYQNLPHGYITPQGYPVGGNNDISPFQNTSTSLPSGSASSSPINQFGYPHPHNHHGQPPFINIEEPMGPRPMIPSEPRMGHYSNYHHSYQPQPYEQWHVPGAHPHPHGNVQQGHGNDQPVVSSSRRSTISNPSDQDRVSRPSTTENQNQSNQVKVKDMVKIEPAPMEEDEDDQEEKLDHRKRKRNRTIRSCVPCHNHKRKCDRKRPCGRCTALGLTGTCVYEIDENRDMSDPTVAESDRLKKRIAELEQVVRELRQKHVPRQTTTTNTAASTSNPAPSAPEIKIDDADHEQDNKKRRVIVDRFARYKIGEAALADVAAAANMDHSPVPGSVGQAKGPHQGQGQGGNGDEKQDYKSETYRTFMNPGEEMVHDKVGRKTFLGAPAGQSMLRRIRELTSAHGATPNGPEDDLLSVPEDHAFGIVFPDMRKTFPFTTIWSHENFSGEIIGLLPNKQQAEVLLEAWKEEVVTIILGYHVPTLEAEYRRFFDMSMTEKMNVPMSCLAVYLMICSCGCVMRAARNEIFGPDERPPTGVDDKDLTSSRLQSELYLSAAYQALRLCSFLSNPTLYTVQAQLLINVYLYASERASDSWSLVGSLVRQCVSLGLHVDPISLDPNVSMRDAEVRRRLWWSVAGLDVLLCSLFGRPSCITYYTTALPQDRTDDNLSDAPGSAQFQLPPSNVLRNETTDMTFHAAYFQLTIPSFELLSRVFSMKRDFSRSTVFGWFSPSPQADRNKDDGPHTYEDALKLASDISAWYKGLPRGIRFDPEEDTPEHLLKTRSKNIINQSLMLCMKTHILLVILHRPYLRFDPAAYPESQEIVTNAATVILTAYETAFQTKASVFWVWWSIPYRTFHAGAVCAFIAIREPSTDRGKKCLATLRNAIHLFEDRLAGWNTAHPVQSDLVNGLVRLEKLATAATLRTDKPDSRRLPPTPARGAPNDSHAVNIPGRPRSPAVAGLLSPAPLWHGNPIGGGSSVNGGGFHTHLVPPGISHSPAHGQASFGPHSMMRGFPEMGMGGPSPNLVPAYAAHPHPHNTHPGSSGSTTDGSNTVQLPLSPMPMFAGEGMAGMGLTPATESEANTLPQFWAEMFGIKLDGDPTLAM